MKLSHIFPFRKVTLHSPHTPTEIYETLKFESRPYKWLVHPFYDNDGMDLLGDVWERQFSLILFRHGFFYRNRASCDRANGTIAPASQGSTITISFSLRSGNIVAMLVIAMFTTLLLMITFVDTVALPGLIFLLGALILQPMHFYFQYKRMLGIFKQLLSATEKEN